MQSHDLPACQGISPPDEADVDAPEMVAASAAVARGERHLRMLARLAEIHMEIAETIAQNAKIAVADGKSQGDPAGSFDKIARAVRRTVALEAKLADQVNTGRADLAEKRVQARATHKAERPELAEMLDDATDRLVERDEFKDYLDRPVGETVARLCAALGFDQQICIEQGVAWMVRSEPYHFENARDSRPSRTISPHFLAAHLPP